MNNQEKHVILGVHVTDRIQHVGRVQEVLSQFGCYIKTRIGLHEASKNFCSPNGVILLEMLDDQSKIDEMTTMLNQIEGVEVQHMTFGHP
ncbi:MAG: hypothetical protein JXD19_10370 [Deltaproteobacteria bacterium]|nr:hypothetical protein [Deltaproteobacteria bacterium]